MPLILESLWRQVRISITMFRFGAVRLVSTAAFLISVLAIVLAPGASPSGWDWTRVLLILASATIALLCFLASREPAAHLEIQRQRLFAAAVLVTCALILNLTFGAGTAVTFSIGFTLIAVLAQLDSGGRSPWLVCGALAIIIPFWIWTALEAWQIGLLLLLPLGVLALVTNGHMRDAVFDHPAATRFQGGMSAHGHRLASWLGILASALLVLIVGLPGDNASTWLAAGAIGAVAGVALLAGQRRVADVPASRSSILICDAALAWIAICWLASL